MKSKLATAISDLTVKIGCAVEHDRKHGLLRIEHLRLPCPIIVPIRGCALERLATDIETYIATLQGNPGGARFRRPIGKAVPPPGASEPDLFGAP
jgi:hypothetical protein